MPTKSKIEPFDHLLGEMYDYEVAKMAGTLPAAVCKRRQKKGIAAYPLPVLERYLPLMGKQTDTAISLLSGVAKESIGAFRRSHGIAKSQAMSASRLAEFDHLLGTISNAELARRAGCSREGIRGRLSRIKQVEGLKDE
nr:hypothetical protein [Pseudomonas syringae pv. actinidiae]